MIYKRKNSKFWYAAFYVKNQDGKLIKRAVSTKTDDKDKAKEMERDLKKAIAELSESKRIEQFLVSTAEKMTDSTIQRPGFALSMVWDKYANHHSQKQRTERTQNSKRIIWNKFLRWINTEFSQITTINDVSREIAAEYLKTIQDKSAVTFNNQKNSLSSIWQILTVEAGIKENIWRLFKGAENDSVRYRDFSLAEIKAITANSNEFWRVAVAVAFFTGLRLKDVVHLKKSQIQDEYITLVPAKTKRKRKQVQIFMHEDLIKILDYHISQSDPENDYIFPDVVERYGSREFQAEFGQILKTCKIAPDARGGVGFHSIRHTFVTINEEIGTARKVISGIVGHGSPVQTANYSHDKKASIAISKMPSLLKN